jgi:nicotinate-nucleotide adenylyltransferase
VRVGILGGTFDPPHVGHLIAAADAADALALDRVMLIPAYVQPLKASTLGTPAGHRLAMTRLAVGDDLRLAVSSIEIERGGLSFTVDTLSEWARQSPDDQRFLLLGGDVLRTFARWREPLEVMRLAELVVWQRGEAPRGGLGEWLPRDASGRIPPHRVLQARQVDVSSTEVRSRVRAGQSIHGFVPDAVRAYIEEAGLYRGGRDQEEGDDQGTDR